MATSKDAEAEITGLNSELTKMTDAFERFDLRPLQKKAYLCMAKCMDNTRASHQAIVTCQQSCVAPIQKAQEVSTAEITNFQSRLQRTFHECRDQAQDIVTRAQRGSKDEAAVAQAQAVYDQCQIDGIRKHRALLKPLEQQLKRALS